MGKLVLLFIKRWSFLEGVVKLRGRKWQVPLYWLCVAKENVNHRTNVNVKPRLLKVVFRDMSNIACLKNFGTRKAWLLNDHPFLKQFLGSVSDMMSKTLSKLIHINGVASTNMKLISLWLSNNFYDTFWNIMRSIIH